MDDGNSDSSDDSSAGTANLVMDLDAEQETKQVVPTVSGSNRAVTEECPPWRSPHLQSQTNSTNATVTTENKPGYQRMNNQTQPLPASSYHYPSNSTVFPVAQASAWNESIIRGGHVLDWKGKDISGGMSMVYNMGDEPERKQFLDDLSEFLHFRGTPMQKVPTMGKKVLDVYKLFKMVVERRGMLSVIKFKLWKDIAKDLDLSVTSNRSHTLKTFYCKYLYPYECAKYNFSKLQDLNETFELDNPPTNQKPESSKTDLSHQSTKAPCPQSHEQAIKPAQPLKQANNAIVKPTPIRPRPLDNSLPYGLFPVNATSFRPPMPHPIELREQAANQTAASQAIQWPMGLFHHMFGFYPPSIPNQPILPLPLIPPQLGNQNLLMRGVPGRPLMAPLHEMSSQPIASTSEPSSSSPAIEINQANRKRLLSLEKEHEPNMTRRRSDVNADNGAQTTTVAYSNNGLAQPPLVERQEITTRENGCVHPLQSNVYPQGRGQSQEKGGASNNGCYGQGPL